MYITCKIVLMLFTSVFLTQWQGAKSSGSNATTQTSLVNEDEVDAALESMDLAEFKERTRRLIPYMTYYVANNYVNSQVLGGAHQQQPHSYERETTLPTNPLIRKPQRLVPVARPIDPRRKPNGHRTSHGGSGTLHKQGDKFVPSVQYNPKDIGGEADYFTPVKYATKFHYDPMEHSETGSASQYDRSQLRPLYVVNSGPASLHRATEYYEKDRPPARPSNSLYFRKYVPNKHKAPVASLHQDYLLDYETRSSNIKAPFASSDYNYPADDFESVRYVNNEPPQRSHPKPTRILAQSIPRQPLVQPLAINLARNPAVNLHDIMKSLQLTNRLPEMLNKDNLDSSIKTLVEILSILNNAKQADYPKLPENELPRAPHRNVPNYNEFKQVYTRPKVVTETRFQATPSPPTLQDETLRYEHETSYEPNANYDVAHNPKHQNVIEYYTPLVQDIDEAKVESYKPTERPQKLEENTAHTYEITEDLADDILEQDRYALPITTETPISKFQLPDGVSTHTQLMPPMTLKYGATRGKPNIDYPAYATIPQTDFNCKEQRYKGFFGDPTTGCQVWHYCDLNGGKSSFLCPNGTIFSQVALTCDWWFNVKCESTPQLYVLNERLYKYILPVMPKFPEDFSGPEVDRYLELKFKEMEAKLKEKKLKKQQEDNVKEKLQGLDNEE